MKRYILLSLAILLPVLFLLSYYFFFSTDGGVTYNGEPCAIHEATGWECPGCGGQRAVYFFLHGHPIQALRYNALFVLLAPLFIYLYYVCVQVYIMKNRKYEQSIVFTLTYAIWIFGAILLFFLLRNIPFTPFTYFNSHF
ncbi:DUF2752 domain-containing protein [Dysgonomonas sp. 25]|uniref:DUF2752 domain-containing protein n=1 Tax=Dysgonomonas sp. 25 TaxID=2302933 RepID=UPI0013D1FCFC|nr:DUF2752 domain-containing protein [Dysgonomonas sp. 25]NDV68456.1 DUF2752 domain-containing protein [Dysgonomonas sp. 25]